MNIIVRPQLEYRIKSEITEDRLRIRDLIQQAIGGVLFSYQQDGDRFKKLDEKPQKKRCWR